MAIPAPVKTCKYLEGVSAIDYKDFELLRKFMTEHGKIIPRRMTGANAQQMRQIKTGIRRARTMGLLP
jgi:small subunit ribosomal protein S18